MVQELSGEVEELYLRLKAMVEDVFEVRDWAFKQTPRPVMRFRGHLLVDSALAYEVVRKRFQALGYTALFRKEREHDVILAVAGLSLVSPSRDWLAYVLFVATLFSTLLAGAAMGEPGRGFHLLSGWSFAVSLMAILLAHELGHYVVARHLGVPVSLPYFIPMPLNLMGTMGAFIRMKGPPTNRRALLAIAAAGPLAGLTLAIPILIIGLSLSEVRPIPLEGHVFVEGNSLLYALLKILMFGRFLPSGGEDVFLHPVAFAGWAGLLVTGLNLIPAGQLDGGHVAYALLGDRADILTRLIILALILLGILWGGWFLWAILIYLLGRSHARLLDEITPLEKPHQALAFFLLFIFLLVFVPIPLTIR